MSPEPTAGRADSGHDADATRRRRFGLSLALALGLIAATDGKRLHLPVQL